MRLVIDASAGLYVVSSERGFAALAEHELVAPALFWSEAISAIHQLRWRRAISDRLAEQARDGILVAPVERATQTDLPAEAWRVADELGWAKTYDAEYVALARLIDVPLLTRDARLRRGAERLVRLVGPHEV